MRFLPEECAKYTAVKGDVLICEGGYPGRAAIWEKDEPIYFQKALHRVRFHESGRNKWFLYYLLAKDLDGTLKSYFNDAGIQHFTGEALARFEVPLPPLLEQHRIVAILDEAFEAIATAKANAEKNLQNARAVFESYLESVFTERGPGWVERRLGDVFDIGSSKRILETEWTASGVPFYGGKEIVKLAKYGTATSNSYISEDKYSSYASKYDMPQQNDILITARGTIGVGYIVQAHDKFYYKDGNIISMRQKMPTDSHFILYGFRSNVFAGQIGDLTGTTVKHLPIEKAKELVLRMPEYAAQIAIVTQIRKIERETQTLTQIYQRKLSALDELKKSLLHQAFSGTL